MKIYTYDSLESTNLYLKENYQKHQSFDVILTHNQTKGKGRRDHTWFSDQHGLTFSILIKKSLNQSMTQLMPFYTAMIIHQKIKTIVDDIQIKWPNDILINGKKAVGILVESIIQGNQTTLIVGIGINVNQTVFPEDITDTATSLQYASGKRVDKLELLKDICFKFESELIKYYNNQHNIINYCNEYLAYKNKQISFLEQNKLIHGICLKINDSGHLQIKVNESIRSYLTGEIILKIDNQ